MAGIGAFGNELKRAREARGVALEAVAGATRIAARYLDAIERSDLLSIPAGPFGKGYIRAYADYLGIDPQPILEAYRTEERDLRPRTPENDHEMLLELSRVAQSRRTGRRPRYRRKNWKRPALFFALLSGITLLLAWWWSSGTDPEPQTRAQFPTPTTEPASPPAVTEPMGPPLSAQRGIHVSGSGVGTNVVSHTLVGQASQFTAGTRVVYWTRVLEGETEEVIYHLWLHEGRVAMRADVTIGGPHWRTYSRFVLPPGSFGSWRVETRTADGRVLDSQDFVCVER